MINPVKFPILVPLPILVVVHLLKNFWELSFADVSHYILVCALKVAGSQIVFLNWLNAQCEICTKSLSEVDSVQDT